MYNTGRGTYTCDFCGFEMEWGAHDRTHGDMWYCEKCGRAFCTKCFEDRYGRDEFREMTHKSGRVLCPDCWKEADGQK